MSLGVRGLQLAELQQPSWDLLTQLINLGGTISYYDVTEVLHTGETFLCWAYSILENLSSGGYAKLVVSSSQIQLGKHGWSILHVYYIIYGGNDVTFPFNGPISLVHVDTESYFIWFFRFGSCNNSLALGQ